MAARVAAACGASVVGLQLAEKVTIAFHEAGHAIVALHISESGIAAENGKRGQLTSAPPFLRFATITPRKTEKGQYYIGETKLTIRWRDMAQHVQWEPCGSQHDAAPVLGLSFCKWLDAPTALLSLARMTYLMGGRASEDHLYAALLLRPAFSQPVVSSEERREEGVRRLLARPGSAVSDLRKAQQLARQSVMPHVVASVLLRPQVASDAPAVASDPTTPQSLHSAISGASTDGVLAAAFGFADEIVRFRWRQTCALSGALLLRGTVDGTQAAALTAALGTAAQPLASEAPLGAADRLLRALSAAGFPFCFGCVFALSACWPPRDPRLPGPGEPRNSLA